MSSLSSIVNSQPLSSQYTNIHIPIPSIWNGNVDFTLWNIHTMKYGHSHYVEWEYGLYIMTFPFLYMQITYTKSLYCLYMYWIHNVQSTFPFHMGWVGMRILLFVYKHTNCVNLNIKMKYLPTQDQEAGYCVLATPHTLFVIGLNHLIVWINRGWMNGYMNGWMDGWMDREMNGWMDEWMDGWMDACMDGWMHACMNGRMDGGMNGWMDGWIEEWMDEWMDEWMEGWMEGWMDNGWMDKC